MVSQITTALLVICEGIHQPLVDSPHKGTIMLKVAPCQDAFMYSALSIFQMVILQSQQAARSSPISVRYGDVFCKVKFLTIVCLFRWRAVCPIVCILSCYIRCSLNLPESQRGSLIWHGRSRTWLLIIGNMLSSTAKPLGQAYSTLKRTPFRSSWEFRLPSALRQRRKWHGECGWGRYWPSVRQTVGEERGRIKFIHHFLINPLRAKFFRENINIYLHFMSFLHIHKTRVVEIPPWVKQGPAYST